LLQLADKLGDMLYVSGEESVGQIKVRANRLGIKKSTISISEDTDADSVVESISSFKGNLKGVIVDSIP